MTDVEEIPNFKASGSPLRWAVLAGVWLAYYCFGLTIVTLAPLVAEISTDLGVTDPASGPVVVEKLNWCT